MRIYQIGAVLVLSIFYMACGGSKSETELAYKEAEYKKTKALLESKNFKFVATASFAMQTNAVVRAQNALFNGTNNAGPKRYLTPNDATFQMANDSVKGRMAYTGEMRISDFTEDRRGAILFDNVMTDFKIAEDKDKFKIETQFKITNGPEGFDVRMSTFENKFTNVIIFGDSRTPIRYEGTITPVN